MTGLLRRGSATQKHRARREWLDAHPEACVGVPGINEDVSDEGRAKLVALQGHNAEAGPLRRVGSGHSARDDPAARQ